MSANHFPGEGPARVIVSIHGHLINLVMIRVRPSYGMYILLFASL